MHRRPPQEMLAQILVLLYLNSKHWRPSRNLLFAISGSVLYQATSFLFAMRMQTAESMIARISSRAQHIRPIPNRTTPHNYCKAIERPFNGEKRLLIVGVLRNSAGGRIILGTTIKGLDKQAIKGSRRY